MSTTYNKTIATLKTVSHDTKLLDAQKILINPGNTSDSSERKNIIDIINDKVTEAVGSANRDDIINSNTSNIASNTANIASNTANIASNTADIASNTANIANLDNVMQVILGTYLNGYSEYNTEETTFHKDIDSQSIKKARSFRLSASHTPAGIINEIQLKNVPANSISLDANEFSSNSTEVYLVVKIYKEHSSATRPSPAIKATYISTNKASNNGDEGYTSWKFDDFVAPMGNEWMRVYAIKDRNNMIHSSYSWLALKCDTTHYHTECGIGGENAGYNNNGEKLYIEAGESNITGGTSATTLYQYDKSLALIKLNGKFYKSASSASSLESDFFQTLYSVSGKGNEAFNTNLDENNNYIPSTSENAFQPSTSTNIAIKGFSLGRPFIQNGIYSHLEMPIVASSGYTTSNASLKMRIKDNRGNTIKTLISENTVNFQNNSNPIWEFKPFAITDEVSNIDFHVTLNRSENIASNQQIVVSKLNKTVTDSATEIAANNLSSSGVVYVIFYSPQFTLNNTIVETEDVNSPSQYINNYGVMTEPVTEEISDMRSWLQEQIVPLKQTSENASFNNVILGAEGKTTRINFKDLIKIAGLNFIKNCTIKGDVIIYFRNLETMVSEALFDSLTMSTNSSLTIEMLMISHNFKLAKSISGSASDITIAVPDDVGYSLQ